MAENRTFTLVGKFDDQITPSLKKLNRTFAAFERTINRGMGRSFRDLNKDLRSFAKDLDSIGDIFDRKATRGVNRFRDGIKAAGEDARVLGRNLSDASKLGDGFGAGMKDGVRAAQSEAKVLGDILKANALIKVGEGVSRAGSAGFQGGMRGIGMIYQFIAKRAKEAAVDQLQDIQARGSLFGSLNKEQLFSNAKNIKDEKQLADINEKNYDTTRSISRAMESSIADVVKSSTVSTATINILSRQLSDNLLPSLLKAEGVTDLSKFEGPEGRKQLDAIMQGEGGKKGVGKELATLYEQMGSIITSPQFAPQAAMGFTQYIGQGTVNRQLSVFENNPVLVDALKKYAIEFGSTTEGRIKALKKALEVAMPEAALQEARTTIIGGVQSIGDTLTNASAGILSMGADIAGQGQKTLAMATANGSLKLQLETFERRQDEQRKAWLAEGAKTDKQLADRKKMEADQLLKFSKGMTRLYENADSPIEIVAASFGPLMQKLADLLGSIGNVFIGPVTAIMDKLQLPLAQLMDNVDSIASNIRAGKPVGEQLGRLVGEFFKAFATLFTPGSVAEQGGSAIQKFFKDFADGFKEVKGQEYLGTIMKGISNFLMNVIFNEGNAAYGLTPLGDGLAKVFALLAAPAFVSALIAGLVPMAIQGMGGMMLGTLTGLGSKLAAGKAAKKAARLATAQYAASLARTASFGSMALGAAPVAAAGAAGGGGAAAAAAGLAAIPVVGWVAALAATVVIFEGPIMALTNTLQDIGKKMQESSNWLTSSFGQVVQGIGQLFGGVTKFFNGLWEIVSGLIMGDTRRVIAGIKKLFSGIVDVLVGIGRLIGGMGGVVVAAIRNIFTTIADLLHRTPLEVKGKDGKVKVKIPISSIFTQSQNIPGSAMAKGSATPFMGNLGQAVNYEMSNKPSGSKLVVANSSETIIPAAGGNGGGMVNFVKTMYSGFTSVVAALSKVQQAQEKSLGQINQTLVVNQQQTNTRLAKLETKFSAPGAGSVGGVDSFTSMARGHGLTMTSGNRPGDKGWHGVNRARDYSNGTGPTPQMMAFARFLASNYGSNLKELIYTPLGFSIKNGQRVPPYARAGHYNHVHVAYAMGAGTPAFFSSQREAMAWENKATLGSVKVSSITSNSSEGMGAGVTVNAPITIHQQPGQSSEQLASLVAMELASAIRQARSSSMYV